MNFHRGLFFVRGKLKCSEGALGRLTVLYSDPSPRYNKLS